MNVRMAELRDLETLIRVRFDYFASENWEISPQDREKLLAQLYPYFTEHLDTDFIAALVEDDGGRLASTAFLAIAEKPANPSFPTGKTGMVLNVLTYPEYRRRGCATMALNRIIDEAKRRNLSFLELSASEMGKPLYEKLGFQVVGPSIYTDMKLCLL